MAACKNHSSANVLLGWGQGSPAAPASQAVNITLKNVLYSFRWFSVGSIPPRCSGGFSRAALYHQSGFILYWWELLSASLFIYLCFSVFMVNVCFSKHCRHLFLFPDPTCLWEWLDTCRGGGRGRCVRQCSLGKRLCLGIHRQSLPKAAHTHSLCIPLGIFAAESYLQFLE